jgi:hypothetical protein
MLSQGYGISLSQPVNHQALFPFKLPLNAATLRIPMHPATCSDLIRPPIPEHPATLAAAPLDEFVDVSGVRLRQAVRVI